MATGKPMNSYYSGGNAEIEMPPLDVVPITRQSDKQLKSSSKQQVQQPEQTFGVPESLPQGTEVLFDQGNQSPQENMELDSTNDSNRDNVSRDEVREDLSQTEDIEQEDEEVVSAPVKKSMGENFKAAREAREKAERERDAYMKHAMELEMKFKQQQYEQERRHVPIVKEEPEFDFSNLDEDSLVDGKHLKAVNSKIRRLEAQLEQRSIEDTIRSRFPDFERVVSVENVERLNQEHPEIAQMLSDTSDVLKKASAAYSVMKKFGIHKDMYQAEKIKAVTNAAKPRPVASVNPQSADSPLSRANAFATGNSEEMDRKLMREMYDSRMR